MTRSLQPEPNAAPAFEVIHALQPSNRSPVAVGSVVAILDHVHDGVAQVFHPWPMDGGPVTWADMAARVGVERSALWPCDERFESARARPEAHVRQLPR